MNITNIIEIVIALIGVVISSFLIPWLKSKTTEVQRERISAVVKTLVSAAEQLYGAGCGAEKLAYVEAALKGMGYTIDIDDTGDSLRAMIEAAVLELNK